DQKEAFKALRAFPEGLMVGGGITADNAKEFIDAGASHVIVTSYVFSNGQILYDNLEKLVKAVGSHHVCLDLSCKKKADGYYVATNRWQNLTDIKVDHSLLDKLSSYASEFLIHAVDVEGKQNGIEESLASLLGSWNKLPITYAGGVKDMEDLKRLHTLSNNFLNVTVGSALDLFGGNLNFDSVCDFCAQTLE
nr:phosphoribosylformimino-5-aminoimidazole carboxamide ribotide isomerase [Lachnospiraceae bacterium]